MEVMVASAGSSPAGTGSIPVMSTRGKISLPGPKQNQPPGLVLLWEKVLDCGRMPWWWFVVIGGAFVVAVASTDVVWGLALRFGIIDAPDGGRKIHNRVTPLLGGVGVYLGFAVPTVIVLLATNHLTSGDIGVREFVGFLVGGLVLVVGGSLDDKFTLHPRVTFAFPLVAVAIATVAGIGISKLTNPFSVDPFVLTAGVSAAFTFVWLLVTTYTTKLLDGVDGVATGVTAIGCAIVSLLSLTPTYWQPDVALLAAIGAASCVGFLLWNAPPARIFLGEGGSTFLGFMLGTLAVISGGKVATALLVLGIPALDVAFVIVRRVSQGKNPFTSSDRQHLHLQLRDRGFTSGQILAMYMTVAALFGATTLIFASWQKIAALATLGLFALAVAVWLTRAPKS